MGTSISSLIKQGAGSWRLGKTERFPSTDTLVEVDGMTLIRRDSGQQIISAGDYPEFYNMTQGFFTDPYFTDRTPTAQTQVRAMDTNGNVFIAVGNGGIISRSIDAGLNWTQITSPVNTNFYTIIRDNNNDRWYIPYASNKVLISINNGTSWVDTTVTGLLHDFTQASADVYNLRGIAANGVTVLACQNKVFVTTDGTAWTDVTASAVGGKLTYGNGSFVIVTPTGSIRYSSNGTAWSTGYTLSTTLWNKNYGLIWDGLYWVWGCKTLTVGGVSSGVADTQPAPLAGYPTGQSGVLQYSTNFIDFNMKYANVGNNNTYASGGFWFWESDTAGIIVGPKGPQGFYANIINSNQAVEQFELYSATPYRTLISNFTTSSPPIDDASILDDSEFYQEIGITGDGIVWSLEPTPLTDIKISGSTATPSKTLPSFTQTGGGEGNWYTRIK